MSPNKRLKGLAAVTAVSTCVFASGASSSARGAQRWSAGAAVTTPGMITVETLERRGVTPISDAWLHDLVSQRMSIIDMLTGQRVPGPYRVADGHLVTNAEQPPIELRIYKIGRTFVGARKGELGVVNYEIEVRRPLIASKR